ncbi:MAG TPA: hypothetical protein GX725_03340 [Mollicutes bacterium]|nr:hypothetical protein [Mollicutes bacterium]
MKRILIAVMSFLFLVGCTTATNASTPSKVVENLMSKYKTLDKDVINQLDKVVENEQITKKQKQEYKELIKKQYQNLTYKIKDETYDDNTAVVSIEIEVFNYAKAKDQTDMYVSGHESDFLDENKELSKILYENYKIEQLKNVKERTKYTLDISLTKEDGKWRVDKLSDMERQKIHGLYNL